MLSLVSGIGAFAGFAAQPAAAQAAPFGRTVLVRSNGDSAGANCNRLRSALDAIVDAGISNSVLVKLERGAYNCKAIPVVLKRFVTIEGAGRGYTLIVGDTEGFEQGVVVGANEAALRHLTVEHAANGPGVAIAVNTSGRRMSLTDVAIKLDSATVNQAYGILADGGMLELTDVSIQTAASGGQSQGILGQSGAALDLMNVRVLNQSGAFGNPAALELDDSSATGFGVFFSSNFFGLLGRGNSFFELVDGTVIGGRGVGADFTGSFSCTGIADENFAPREPDCSQ
jgi:hypothetical protein